MRESLKESNREESGRQRRISTGVPGVDEILRGGLPAGRTYLVEGEPGTGKTTLGIQFLLEGARRGERGVYVALSESREELEDIAASHGWDLSTIDLVEIQSSEASLQADSQYTFFHPSEVELSDTTRTILDAVERVEPTRVVFDSLSEMRLLARDSLRYRRQLLSLKQYFTETGCTVLLLDIDDPRTGGDGNHFRLETLAHGYLHLQQLSPEYGEQRRRLRFGKLRGVDYEEGYHDYRILRGGLEVYPRLVAAAHDAFQVREPLPSGVAELDSLLGGGIERGATTVFLGPAGVGKSTISTVFVEAALARGERCTVFLFDESPHNWHRRNEGLGLNVRSHLDTGRLDLHQMDPAQVSPGEIAHMVRKAVLDDGVGVVLLDSINGYRYALPHEDFLTLHLHELFTFLNQQGVVTLVVMAQHGFLGEAEAQPLHISYLADSVLLLRYFEAAGKVRKAVSVVKKSTGGHERAIRELIVGPAGVEVGEELRDFQGVLGGDLRYRGDRAPLLDHAGRAPAGVAERTGA